MINEIKAYSLKTRALILTVLFVSLTALDQWTKLWAVDALKGKIPRFYLMGTFQLRYAENTGAWGNLGGDWTEPWRSLFLIGLPIVIILGFTGFYLLHKQTSKIESWAYALIITGGAGNLIDRVRFNYVVDFLYIGIKEKLDLFLVKIPLETNIFNVADVVIMTGAFLILFHLIRDKIRTLKNPSASTESTPEI